MSVLSRRLLDGTAPEAYSPGVGGTSPIQASNAPPPTVGARGRPRPHTERQKNGRAMIAPVFRWANHLEGLKVRRERGE